MQFPIALLPSIILLMVTLPWTGAIITGNATTSDPLSSSDVITLASITQLLSLFSISLDIKDFAALRDVFATDAVLTGGGPEILTGIDAIEEFYTMTFQNESLKTVHTSDTVYGYNLRETTASSFNYATAVYFGPAVLERGGFLFSNSSVIYRERFITQYAKNAHGALRISRQQFTIFSIEGPVEIL
ncbi:MAG: hypothetical protein L6R35_000741 [Caloplaca aegaea]|nr:MAG: hypothetical protein L6R35_000741 [Caloplaca aegaea]